MKTKVYKVVLSFVDHEDIPEESVIHLLKSESNL